MRRRSELTASITVCARQSVEPPGLCTSDKAEMIARSSGSIRAESAVELTRSEKHHEELSMLGAGGGCRSCDRRLRSLLLAGCEFSYRAQQLPSMTERHPDLFKVLIREIGQDGKTDVGLGKALGILSETLP